MRENISPKNAIDMKTLTMEGIKTTISSTPTQKETDTFKNFRLDMEIKKKDHSFKCYLIN